MRVGEEGGGPRSRGSQPGGRRGRRRGMRGGERASSPHRHTLAPDTMYVKGVFSDSHNKLTGVE